MSRIIDMALEPQTVYEGNKFVVKIKVQDDYKYKKYLITEDIQYKVIIGSDLTITDADESRKASVIEIKGAGKNDILGINNGTIESNGLKITINNGIITINGTCTASGNYKLTNGLERAGTVSTAWKNETCVENITDKTFYFKYISGTADTSGCALRLYSPNNMDQWYFQQKTQTKLYTNTTQIGAEGKVGCILIYSNSGRTFNNYTFKLVATNDYNFVKEDNNIFVSNRNLFDISNTIDRPSWNNKICDRIITDANNFILKSNATDDWCGIYAENLDSSKEYTIKFTATLLEGVEGNSLYVGTADANSPRIAIYTNTPKEIEYTFTNSTKIYIKIVSQTRVRFSNVELVIGDATNYIQHSGNSYRVDLGGNNLIQNNMANQTINGIKFTINEDKSIKVEGTATARTEPNLWTNANWIMKAGTNYYNNSNTTIYLYGSYNGANAYYIFNAGATYKREYDYIVQRVYIRVENGATVDTTYYPYIGLKKSKNYSPYTASPIELTEQDKIWNDGGVWKLNNIEITDDYLLNQLEEINNIDVYENLMYVDWTGEVKATIDFQYPSTEILKDYIITEDGKKIRTDWRNIGRREKWTTK